MRRDGISLMDTGDCGHSQLVLPQGDPGEPGPPGEKGEAGDEVSCLYSSPASIPTYRLSAG
jgi:hypothetical protein